MLSTMSRPLIEINVHHFNQNEGRPPGLIPGRTCMCHMGLSLPSIGHSLESFETDGAAYVYEAVLLLLGLCGPSYYLVPLPTFDEPTWGMLYGAGRIQRT
ncbi:hypothetical protein VNO77_37705 [Canavalia gladiata]|uniref:Uncharacterized protein n=1 Tax=Canavalia gladiata TaxID=3824 RepID=A0AAN9K962_CANGL